MTNVVPLPPRAASGCEPAAGEPDAAAVVADLKAALAQVALDCDCRLTLERALEQFAILETVRLKEAALVQGRGRRRQILLILDLLAEIDEVAATEPDQSVFEEFARLFDDVAAAARDGAGAMRRAAVPLPAPTLPPQA